MTRSSALFYHRNLIRWESFVGQVNQQFDDTLSQPQLTFLSLNFRSFHEGQVLGAQPRG